MKTVLITGANRGLGLGMVQYLARQSRTEKIIATCRKPSEELQKLSQESKKLHIIHLDVTNLASFDDVSKEVAKAVGASGLNLLVNNAGVATKYTRLSLVKADQLLDALNVNTIAPIMLTKSLLPLLKQASEANSSEPMSASRAAVVNVSSVLGSIADNDKGGFYPYRCSKAALNAATKSMSIDLKSDHILVTSIHPGWVRTALGGPNAPLDVNTAIPTFFDTIQKLGEADTGKFLQYDGKELPW